MPHERIRHCLPLVRKLGALWPAVGVIGPRQCGKTTLLSHQLGLSQQHSLDDEETLDAAQHSAKVFVSRLLPPVIIDEAQKAPPLFDALKAAIDRKRRPGQYYLTGSSQFSARIGIRESLTGRIGLLHLQPLTLAETYELPYKCPIPLLQRKPRITTAQFSKALSGGGMPVPIFLRDPAARRLYWQSWIETTVYRDVARFFKQAYDPRITLRILRRLKEVSAQGEYLGLSDIAGIQRRTLLRYLTALEDIFVLRRVSCHETGVGKDHWIAFDSGFLDSLFDSSLTEGATLSLARTLLWQDLCANLEYGAKRILPTYFKSRLGKSPVDIVWNNIPIKIITSPRLSSIGWEERALAGAMKSLGVKVGLLAAPISEAHIPKSGIGAVPWGHWS